MSNVQNLFSQPSFPSPLPGQSFFGSGNIQIFNKSGTFIVPPGVTRIRVRVWGAGGSGGNAVNSPRSKAASGGGGGGLAIKIIDTTPGTSYAVTVGTGGAAVDVSTGTGIAGGTSSFGSVCSATGGGGGNRAASNSTAPVTAAGAAGGTATGGDFNYSGGGSGTATVQTIDAANHQGAATGGGSAASIFGNGFSSGTCTINAPVPIGIQLTACTGGAGVGGSSGAVSSAGGATQFLRSGGGGTYGPSNSITTAIAGSDYNVPGGAGFTFPFSQDAAVFGQSPTATLIAYNAMPAEFYCQLGNNSAQISLGTGIGSGFNRIGSYPPGVINRFPGDILIGSALQNDNATTREFSPPGVGTSFFGSGGTVNTFAGPLGGGTGVTDPGNNNTKGGHATVGGGGGGNASYITADFNATSGRGGNGQVIVEW